MKSSFLHRFATPRNPIGGGVDNPDLLNAPRDRVCQLERGHSTATVLDDGTNPHPAESVFAPLDGDEDKQTVFNRVFWQLSKHVLCSDPLATGDALKALVEQIFADRSQDEKVGKFWAEFAGEERIILAQKRISLALLGFGKVECVVRWYYKQL